MKNVLRLLAATVVVSSFAACGGGGGGGGGGYVSTGGGGTVLYYPYETVYGDACATYEATPGCTFNRNGTRITVTQDPDYDKYGYTSDDLWFVEFDSSGRGKVYDDLGHYQYTAYVSAFAGYVGGTSIGVGTSGFYWEDIRSGTYWLGKNGVLYNANKGESNWGKAINEKGSSQASDTNFAAMNSDSNKKLIKMAADKLVKDYGFQNDKATAIATALNSWAVAGAERGITTEIGRAHV